MTTATNPVVQIKAAQSTATKNTAQASKQSKAPEKSFQQTMQEVQAAQDKQAQQAQQASQSKQAQQTAQSNTAQQTAQSNTTQQTAQSNTTQQTSQGEQTKAEGQNEQQGVEGKVVLVDGELKVGIKEVTAQGMKDFLASLFGPSALEGVDMEQSDMEILKDIYDKVTDPAAQFALMLMMAFLQDNPDKSITDIQNAMGTDLQQNPEGSPVQKVFAAITKLASTDEAIKSSPLLDHLMQMAKSAQGGRPVTDYKQFEAQLMNRMPQPAKQTQVEAELIETQILTGAPQQKQAVVVTSPLEAQNQFRDAITQAREMMTKADTTGTGEKRENGLSLDVEKLQAQVNAGSFMQGTARPVYQLQQAGAVQEVLPETLELVNQVKTGILTGLEKGENEFVLKLRPEGLGELTIKLVETAGAKMTLSIVASNTQTQKLLSGELGNLQALMKPLNVEVQPVTTSQEASTAEQFMAGQFNQQQFGEHNHNGQLADEHVTQFGQDAQGDEQEEAAVRYPRSIGTAALDTYI